MFLHLGMKILKLFFKTEAQGEDPANGTSETGWFSITHQFLHKDMTGWENWLYSHQQESLQPEVFANHLVRVSASVPCHST